MPVGLEVNDYDSEEDVSSTEDDNLNLPVTNTSNKKMKKKKTEKKSILKESKFIKDKAKEKIKNMENKVKDIDSVDYLSNDNINNRVTFGEDDVREFFTDEELADQLKELEKLQGIQRELWKVNRSHVHHEPLTAASIRGINYSIGMNGMFSNVSRSNNRSRTEELKTTSRVNTHIPIMGGSRVISKGYNNLGRMW